MHMAPTYTHIVARLRRFHLDSTLRTVLLPLNFEAILAHYQLPTRILNPSEMTARYHETASKHDPSLPLNLFAHMSLWGSTSFTVTPPHDAPGQRVHRVRLMH